MKVLIISDSHGRDKWLDYVIENEKGLDRIIHLGDLEGSEEHLETIAPCPVEIISGNNDYFAEYPREKVIQISGHKILLTHGHYYGVSFGRERLAGAARMLGCSMAMYGHTHCPEIDEVNGIRVINPGSLAYPRQENRKPSYIIMETDGMGRLGFSLRYIE